MEDICTGHSLCWESTGGNVDGHHWTVLSERGMNIVSSLSLSLSLSLSSLSLSLSLSLYPTPYYNPK